MSDLERDTVHLVRFALDGRTADVVAVSRRLLPLIRDRRPDLASEAAATLAALPTKRTRSQRPSPSSTAPLPVDVDSRLGLLRREDFPVLPNEPVWRTEVAEQLNGILVEHRRAAALAEAGLSPTRSALLVGPPGVGKTLSARWLAMRLGRPLLTLDLSAVMSSFLGRTGNNIRVVLDYARREEAVLLLDEFDALAKRRDDDSDIGELKRLVTVLLQEIDDWPSGGLLLAATNHSELLDRAVWRRFERVISFPDPTADEISRLISSLAPDHELPPGHGALLGLLLTGRSFADVAREVTAVRRSAVIEEQPTHTAFVRLVERLAANTPHARRIEVAERLSEAGWSQRETAKLTHVSRDTIRKRGPSTPSKVKAPTESEF